MQYIKKMYLEVVVEVVVVVVAIVVVVQEYN